MAAAPTPVPLQIVNVDLAPERQNLLRSRLGELFKVINRKSPATPRSLVYTVNAEDTALEKVLRANPDADAVLTGFRYAASASEAYKEALTTDQGAEDALHVDPQLRYPLIAAFRKAIDRGLLRHRQLVLVDDLGEQIAYALRAHVPVEVSVFTGEGRDEASQFIPIYTPERISPKLDGPDPDPEKFALGQICAIRLAGVEFASVVHMPEVGNRFQLHEPTLLDTTRKLYRSESVRHVSVRERQQAEKFAFVRGKRVFMVLEPDLDHVIGERLIFDKMQRLYRHHSLAEAERALAQGKSQGIVEYFENHGYDLVFDALNQEERDALMVAVLGDRLGEFLQREMKTQRAHLPHLEDAELDRILYRTPEPVLNALLGQLQEQAHERFLSGVPAKIREPVILEFLSKPETVKAAWAGIGEAEQTEVLTQQAPLVMAHLNLMDSGLFSSKFPNLNFEFARNYSSESLANLSKAERDAAFALFQRSLAQANVPPGALAERLSPQEIEACMAGYIRSQPTEFYNRLSPVVRKQLWVTVAKGHREHIHQALHFLDKVEIVKGNKELALGLLFGMKPFLAHLKAPDGRELAATVFLALKRTNKAESKTALLRKLLRSDEWRAHRLRGVPELLSDPEQINLYKKLADKVEGLEFVFDSVVALRADWEKLKDRPPLRDATVTLVDELVDDSLLRLFDGEVSREDYATFSATVEQQIKALRDKLTAREAEDPLGVYILESMQMLNAMADRAMHGESAQAQLDAIDERLAVRKRLETGIRDHLGKIRDFLERGEQQVAQLETKAAHAEQLVAAQAEATDTALEQARGLMGEVQRLQQIQRSAGNEKRKVALAQKELSLEFFRLIQPLLLERIKRWPAPVDALLRKLWGRPATAISGARRVIFRFSDEEIERIMRYRIVFCTKDEILMQFVATCLEIDRLEESLFTMATRETLPPETIDILFYGPGYTAEDFEGRVKRRRMIAFADEAFEQRLLANEKLKARTKSVLAKVARELAPKQKQLTAAGEALKTQQAKLRKMQAALDGVNAQRGKLEQRMAAQREKRQHFQGELELMEQRFEEVDRRFETLREHIGELAGEGGDAAAKLAEGSEGLGEKLREELMAINRELARMHYIKSVKDAGAAISRGTQQGILQRMESRERYDFKQRPFKKLIVADDGSILGRNMKTAFVNACAQHFKVREMAVEDVTLRNLDGRAEVANTKDYPFIAVMAGEHEDQFGDLRRIVRKVRNRMPQTYQLVLAPLGEVAGLDHDGATFENLRSIKDNAALVNVSVGDFTVPAAMLQVLQEKAPLG